MANQPEVAVYEAGIYQFETTDVVEGGVGGIDNRPLLELANRTAYLKQHVDTAETNITTLGTSIATVSSNLSSEIANRIAGDNALQALITQINRFLPKNRGYFTGLNVGNQSGSLTTSGNVTGAVLQSTNSNMSKVLVTLQNSMGNTNYKIKYEIDSRGTIENDADHFGCCFDIISATQFYFQIAETTNNNQNLRVHIEAISLD